VRGSQEVFDRDDWGKRLGIELRHIGFAMSDAASAELSERIDPAAALEYRAAVGRETQHWLSTVDMADLDRPLPAAGDRVAISHDLLELLAEAARAFFANRTAGWVLTRVGFWHNFLHLGQVEHVMHSLGICQ